MLRHRLIPARLGQIREVSRPTHARVQRGVARLQHVFAGGSVDAQMDRLVAAEILGAIGAGVVQQHLEMERADLSELLGGDARAGKFAR